MRGSRWLLLAARHPQLRWRWFAVDGLPEFQIHPGAKVSLGRRVRFLRGMTLHVHPDAELLVGDGVSFSHFCTVAVHSRVEIGADTTIGENVSIHDEDHPLHPRDVPLARRGFTSSPVVIGRNVWIGAKATVTRGVTIGDNSVIGANSVVTRDIPPDSIAVGAPAQVVKTVADA